MEEVSGEDEFVLLSTALVLGISISFWALFFPRDFLLAKLMSPIAKFTCRCCRHRLLSQALECHQRR